MPIDTNVSQLVINKLTKAQYDEAAAAGEINETELYFITDGGNSTGATTFRIWQNVVSFTIIDTYGGVGDETTLGDFTIPEGYTWRDFCGSSHNPSGAYAIDNGRVWHNAGYNVYDSDWNMCQADDLIISATYKITA